MQVIFDIEADNLYDDVTKIHCLSYKFVGDTEVNTLYYKEDIEDFFAYTNFVFIGHNVIGYDFPVLKKIYGIEVPLDRVIDTLPLSWYLEYDKPKHGLETWGDYLGVKKVQIEDWSNLSIEDYTKRCEEDVKINSLLWDRLVKKLEALYGKEKYSHAIKYLNFKLDCAREQEQISWRLDYDAASTCKEQIESELDAKKQSLKEVLPQVKVYNTKTKPARPFKQDNTLSVSGWKWFKLLKEYNLPPTYTGTVEVFSHFNEPNPGSDIQIKDWLFSLGWEPETYKYVKDTKTGKERMIPQVRKHGELCESVKKLIPKNPAIEILEGYTVLQHRLGIFKAFLSNARQSSDGNWWLKASVGGLTNTLRFQHRNPLVNLPSVEVPWGKEIRSCLLASDENSVLAGADLSSLESTTKRHYMKPYDPEYVEEMSQPGFDEHLNLAKFAGVISEEQEENHKKGIEDLSSIRKAYKVVNYSAIYGIQKKKLSRELGISQKEAQELLDAYWQRNWSVNKVVASLYIKETAFGKWLFNPVSRMYYQLRYEKDSFSTLNQGTGVFCFDVWMKQCRQKGCVFIGQFHDENIAPVECGMEATHERKLTEALEEANQMLKLNVPLGMEVKFGKNYAEVH